MPSYRYKARDSSGKAVKGVISGEDKKAVARSLDSIGYIPIAIEDVVESRVSAIMLRAGKVTLTDLNTFTRQLLTLQKSGLPLLTSLGAIERQMRNPGFRDIIKEIIASIETGASMSAALEKHPRVFNELYVNMIRAGEAGGILDDILERLAEFGEKELETRARIQSATRYPMIAFGALILAFLVVVTFVIPKFSVVFAQYKTALPLPTRILMGLSVGIREWWFFEIALLAFAIFGIQRYRKTLKGRVIWDTVKLKMPIFGPLMLMIAIGRLTRVMAILIKSGLPILQVLEMAARTADNVVVSNAMAKIGSSVRDGKGLTEPMHMTGLFPPIVLQMVAVGEETGKVDDLLLKVSEYFEQQSDHTIKNLTVMIEPIFILILGAMVLVMGLAIFLPMWNFSTLFRQ